jgi:nucleotide-binding universal stress UspA family protein
MKTIIVPIDFSPVSINAANFAADMAVAIQGELVLVNIYNIPVAYSGDVPLMMISVDELKAGSEQKLEKISQGLQHITSGKITVTSIARLGNTVDELEAISNEIKPFAIVMGTKGKGVLEKFVFGSTTLAAIRHLTWPLICVPQGREYGKGINKIGFACDFKDIAESTPVDQIRGIVKTFNARLHILNVDYMEKNFRSDTPEQSRVLHELFSDLTPEYHYIDHPDIEDGIHDFAETNNLDLVITIPKKHKLLQGLFKESSTKQLVMQAHVPVMCIHE